MRILLIDADSTIPNLALMRLSAWHKQQGDSVELAKLGLPYYPHLKKRTYNVPSGYDRVYCSVVFQGNRPYIKGDGVTFGGTGVDLSTELPEEVEQLAPDYSIYPDNKKSYGFITRGCCRSCDFCVVPEKEGAIRKVSSAADIAQHSRVVFLDNNILAYPGHEDILEELARLRIKCEFCQGLDIRLLNEVNALLLYELNYSGEYIFAFDDYKFKNLIAGKLPLLAWRYPWQIKFFVYIDVNRPVAETVRRINWLKARQLLPYIMRDKNCWTDPQLSKFYVDIAAYCNQVGIFKKLSFPEFLVRRHTNQERIKSSSAIWYDNL